MEKIVSQQKEMMIDEVERNKPLCDKRSNQTRGNLDLPQRVQLGCLSDGDQTDAPDRTMKTLTSP